MSREPKSWPVSWEDELLTICSSKAESPFSDQDYDDTISDDCSSYDEGGVESMTPFEFGCYSRRLWHIEKMNVLLRDICFGGGIVDQLPEHKIASMDNLYTPFYLDREIIRWRPGQPNKALRWRLMSQIWRILCELIFDQLTLAEKNPETDPLLIVKRGIAAQKVKQSVEPFQTAGAATTRELHAEIEDVVRTARALFRILLRDSSANYSFYDIKDQSYGGPLLLYSQLINAAQKVDTCGASHRDASEDRICITASAGLIHHIGEKTFLEKKAGVVLYRRSKPRSTTLRGPS
ncbi:hypothetical protein ACHAPE_005586 [Trichoderma viride]